MADFVGWNARLLPNGLQVSLFGATSGAHTPGYFPVKLHRWYALVLSLLLIAVIVGGILVIRRPEGRRVRDSVWRSRWTLLVLAATSTSTLVVAFTQRPRPEYLYPLTITLMVVVGYCVAALVHAARVERYAPVAGVAFVILLVVALGSYYHPRPRPLHDALERLQPVKGQLREPGSVLVAAGYNAQLCAYLSDGTARQCTSPDWNSIAADVGGRRTLADVLREIDASVVYADPILASQPGLASLLRAPGRSGWRVAASGRSKQGPWRVLVPVGASGAAPGGPPTALPNLPAELGVPGLSPSGIYADGWSRKDASLTLAGGPAASLALTGQTVPLGGRTQRLDVGVNGATVQSMTIPEGVFDVSAPLPASPEKRHISLRWSETAPISGRDPRKAAALLQSVVLTDDRPPTFVRFPGAAPGTASTTGIFADGWSRQDARLTLRGGGPATLVIRADIPSFAGQRVDVDVNGHTVGSVSVESETFDRAFDVPASSESRRVRLRWTRAARLGSKDPRVAAARLTFVGLATGLLPGERPSPILGDGGFEARRNPAIPIDTGRRRLEMTTSTKSHSGSHGLELVNADRNNDDYAMLIVKRVSPGTTYRITAWVDARDLSAPALGGRGLFAIGKASGRYDGSAEATWRLRAPTSNWRPVTLALKTGPTDDEIEIRLYAPKGTTYWDDVAISEGTARPGAGARQRSTSTTARRPFRARLSPENEVPTPSGDTQRAGATFVADLSGTTLRWRLGASGLTGQVVAAVLRSGSAGVVGDRFVVLCQPCALPASGTEMLSEAKVRQLEHGPTYINLGTVANPHGEVRGQLLRG